MYLYSFQLAQTIQMITNCITYTIVFQTIWIKLNPLFQKTCSGSTLGYSLFSALVSIAMGQNLVMLIFWKLSTWVIMKLLSSKVS